MDRAEELFRSTDLFGEKVKLTYKGKRSYKTNIGAFVSILVRFIMVAYIAFEFYIIFGRVHPNINVKNTLNDWALNPQGDLEQWSPLERGFDIAIGVLSKVNGPNNVSTSPLYSVW